MERATNISGRDFRVKKLGIRFVHKEASTRIISLWADRFRRFIETISESNGSAVSLSIINDMKQRSSELLKIGFSAEEVTEWIYSLEGMTYVFWMSIRDNHEDMTLDKCEQFVDTLETQEFLKVRDAVEHAQGITVNPSLPGETPAIPTATALSVGNE